MNGSSLNGDVNNSELGKEDSNLKVPPLFDNGMQVHVTGWGYIALLNVVGVAAAMLHQKARL